MVAGFKSVACGVRLVAAVAMASGLVGCGSSSNFNRIWGQNDKGGDSLLVTGQAAYDAGDFSRAEGLVQQLIARNPDNEAAAVLLGFIHLSQGSIDPISIARELVALSPNSSSSGSGTKASNFTNLDEAIYELQYATTATVEQDAATKAATDAAGILTSLSSLVKLSSDEVQKLYLHKFAAADNPSLNGATPTQPQLFIDGNSLEIPAAVGPELRASISALSYINMAIKDVCRYVDPEVKVDGDERNSAGCAPTEHPRLDTAKSHFLWILAHLSEALVFQPVILYTAPGSTLPSLNAVSALISSKKVASLDEIETLTENVTEVKNAVGVVFNPNDPTSMLRATLQDLNAVTNGFSRLAGLPSKVQDSLTKAFASITSLGKELGSATSVVNNSNGFKAQMTQALSKSVGTKIQAAAEKAAAEKSQPSAAQVQDMCKAFNQLNAGAPPSVLAASKPKACS